VAVHRDKLIEVLQWLLDNDQLKMNDEMKLDVTRREK